MFSPLAFFSFVSLTDQTQHRAYNEWHQLDHRPENLALPGVAWGDRWERPRDYDAASSGSDEFLGTDYVAMYWFRDPVEQSVAEWDELGADSFQWGRGPLLPGVQRTLLAFFRPVRGYSSPRALVSPDILPFRPNRGLHVSLTGFEDPFSDETHDAHRRDDRETIPALLDIEGVAGAWTFGFARPQRHTSLPLDTSPADAPGSSRIRLLYLDRDPADVAPAIAEVDAAITRAPGESLRFASPVRTIIPWVSW